MLLDCDGAIAFADNDKLGELVEPDMGGTCAGDKVELEEIYAESSPSRMGSDDELGTAKVT